MSQEMSIIERRDSATPVHASGGMHRELRLVDAAAFSVGLIGPVGAIALLGTGAAGIIGRGVTLSFIFAVIGVALVGYAFIKLSQHISHSGSVYALVGITLGPRAGFFAGWALFGAYTAIGTGSTIEIGLFGDQFLADTGIAHLNEYVWIALLGLLLVCALAFNEIRVVTRTLLASELAGVVLVTILSLVILAKVIFGHGPQGQTMNGHFLQLPQGAGLGTVASAAVYGFLAFAGFEGAAALGEETDNPKTEIPRAIRVAIIVVGAFYLLTAAAQSLGYGTNAAGVKNFVGGFPFGDLGKGYIGSVYADLLILMATISLIAISLGTASGAARILFALSRDAAGSGKGFAVLSRHGQPARALILVIVIMGAGLVGQRLAGSDVLDATFYALTLGTISLLVAYVLATVGAIRFVFFAGPPKAPLWQAVIPTLGGAFVIYTIYKNVVHVASPYSYFGWLVLVWLLVGLALVALVPGLAGRVRSGLALASAP
jgi:amino acid transporter